MKLKPGEIVVIWPFGYKEPIFCTIVRKISRSKYEVFGDNQLYVVKSSFIVRDQKSAIMMDPPDLADFLAIAIQKEIDKEILNSLKQMFSCK